MEPNLSRRMEWAGRVARAAGAAAMRHYGSAAVEVKADLSPVTAADHAANRLIVEAIRAAFPGEPVLSEESADPDERLAAARVWIVDPLDGTREFLACNGEFSVMIGLASGGRAVLGAIYLPAARALYTAAEGAGAWVQSGDGLRRRLAIQDPSPHPLRLVGSRSHPDPLLSRMQAALGIADVEACGSVGVKCTRIAEGHRDLYIHPVPHLKEWDTCAPEALLCEAGGWMGDCRGAALRYNKPDPRHPAGLVASRRDCAAAVLAEVRPVYESARTAAA